MKLPPYWKRGAVYGVVVGLMLHFLLQSLQARTPEMPLGNVPTQRNQKTPHRGTPLGLVLGLTIFALFCVMPDGKPEERRR